MATFVNTFEGGSAGTTITAGNSGGSSGTAFGWVQVDATGAATFATSAAGRGALGAAVSIGGTSGSVYFEMGGAAVGHDSTGSLYVRMRVRLPTLPAATVRVAIVASSASDWQAVLAVNSTGKILLQSTTGATLATTTASVTAGAWFDVSLAVLTFSSTVGQAEARLYLTPNSETVTETLTSAANLNTLSAGGTGYILLGIADPVTNAAIHLDDLQFTKDGYPTSLGPAGTPTTPVVSGTPQAFNFNTAGTVLTYTGGGATGTDVHDVLCVNSDTVISTPAGWTVRATRVVNQGSYIFTRQNGTTSATINFTGPSNTHAIWTRMANVRSIETLSASAAGVDVSSGTSTPALSTGALTTGTDAVLAFAALHEFAGSTPTSPVWSSGYTQQAAGARTGGTAVYGNVAVKAPAGTASESPSLSWTNATLQRYILAVAFTALTSSVSAAPASTSTLTASAVLIRPGVAALASTSTLTAAVPLSTVVDTFSGALDSALWPGSYGSPTTSGGRARIPCGTGFAALKTASVYAFDSVYLQVFAPAANGATQTYVTVLLRSATQAAGVDLGFHLDTGTGLLEGKSRTGYFDPSPSSTTYNATDHRWLRLRRSGANTLFEVSPDATSWTTLRTMTTPAWLSSAPDLSLTIESHRNTGATNYAEIDNVNVADTTVSGAAALASTSTLAATALTARVGAAAIASTSTLTATALTARVGAAALASTSTLTASTAGAVAGTASASSASTLTATPATARVGAAAPTSTSTLVAAAIVARQGVATVTSVSTLAATGARVQPAGAALPGASTLTAAAVVVEFFGMASLASASTLTAEAGLYNRPGRLVATDSAPHLSASDAAARLVTSAWP